MMKRISLVFTVCIVILAAGCMTVGPDYVPTEPKVPEQFSSDLSGGLTVEPLDKATLSQWWATLNDPELTDLIDRAIAGSLDLREAAARILEARAQRGISCKRHPKSADICRILS